MKLLFRFPLVPGTFFACEYLKSKKMHSNLLVKLKEKYAAHTIPNGKKPQPPQRLLKKIIN